MLRIITITFGLVFGLMALSDISLAGDYASCAGCPKAKQVDEAAVESKGYDHCVKTGTEGVPGKMPAMKAKAEAACKDKFHKE